MQFTYRGKNKEGEIVSGTISADDRSDAVKSIRDSGILPVSVEQKSGMKLNMKIPLFNSVKLSEKIMFTKNVSGMLRAGLSLSRALVVLGKQTKNEYFKKIITSLLETIDKGSSLSEGLAKYPRVFSSLFVAMVKSGEESGGLPAALSDIGVNLEKTYALNRKIKSALMYPSIIIAVIVIIGILMFVYVVPTLVATFKDLGAELPTSTKIIIFLSDFISGNVVWIVVILLVLVAGGYAAFRMKSTKRMIDFVSVRVPVLGTLIQEINAARTARTLSSLISSGVDISRAITITKEVLQNTYYKTVLDEALSAVERGEPISGVFKRHLTLYPVMLGEMMEVGEETGKLTGMLSDVALFYEGEVEAKTKDLSTIIEPVLMVFIGAAVGFFAVSMLSPMYSIMDSIQ
ncbi:type II secretion system F family protein [Candidatus Nomurabacteria bacterium]|nr:type II secretion system F family protein [Candidatus Nomurabacteria bacterium]